MSCPPLAAWTIDLKPAESCHAGKIRFLSTGACAEQFMSNLKVVCNYLPNCIDGGSGSRRRSACSARAKHFIIGYAQLICLYCGLTIPAKTYLDRRNYQDQFGQVFTVVFNQMFSESARTYSKVTKSPSEKVRNCCRYEVVLRGLRLPDMAG